MLGKLFDNTTELKTVHKTSLKNSGSSFRSCVGKLSLVSKAEILVFKISLIMSCEVKYDKLLVSLTEFFES